MTDVFAIKGFEDLINLAISETQGFFGPMILFSFVALIAYQLSKHFDILLALFFSLIINILTVLILIYLGALGEDIMIMYVVLLASVGTIAYVRR